MKLASGHTVEEPEGKRWEQYRRDFPGSLSQVVRLQPGGHLLPRLYTKYADRLYNFKFRADDVVVMTYPKCGTTWTQEIVWNMRDNPNLDNPRAGGQLFVRSPFIDFDPMIDGMFANPEIVNAPFGKEMLEALEKYSPGGDCKEGVMLQIADGHPGPRTLKTHLPFSLLPPNILDTCKVVYVTRNPKDNLLSYLHHTRLVKLHGFTGDLDLFVQYYVDNMMLYGNYAESLKEAWARRGHPNLHMLYFEDLKADIRGQLRKLDQFLGTGLTEQQLDNVIQHTSFSNLKKKASEEEYSGDVMNKDVEKKDGSFFRQGKSGTWKDKFTAEQEAKIDAWIKTNFEGSGVEFKFE